jgi:uncharacterized protein YjbI with pentapeptide repeats
LRLTNLSEADLSEANLGQTSLCEVNLTGAYLREPNIEECSLQQANLTDVDLSEAIIYLEGADMNRIEGAIFCNTTMPDGKLRNEGCEENYPRQNKRGIASFFD